MKTILVPSPITVTAPEELGDQRPEEISFLKFALLSWLDDDRGISGGFVKQVRWADVVARFRNSKDGAIDLEDEDYATLKAIVESPQRRLPPSIAIQLLAFTRAVLDAK